MNYEFRFDTSINQDAQNNIETRIREDLEVLCPFTPCHEGSLLVLLSSQDPLEENVDGTIKCNCGKPLGTIKGKINGSNMTYSSVE